MKALTLYQPWASLVALGVKTIETRSWSTKYRGLLAIHAGRNTAAVGAPIWDECASLAMVGGTFYPLGFPSGEVIATCVLVDVVPIVDDGAARNCVDIRVGNPSAGCALRQDVTARINSNEVTAERITDIADQVPYGDFIPGRFAWVLDHIEPLNEPVPARGRQQLWEWTP